MVFQLTLLNYYVREPFPWRIMQYHPACLQKLQLGNNRIVFDFKSKDHAGLAIKYFPINGNLSNSFFSILETK